MRGVLATWIGSCFGVTWRVTSRLSVVRVSDINVNMSTRAEDHIQVISDLHLENPTAYDVFEIPPRAPHLALIGDIGHAKDDGLYHFLRKQLEAFETVFYVLGNHEPYHTCWHFTKSRLRDFETSIDGERQSTKSLGRFVLLDRTRYDLSSQVTILGCTLHSRVQSAQSDHVSFGLNDFYHIKDWTTDKHTEAHDTDVAWLDTQVSEIAATQPDRQLIVFTHHSPTTDPRTIHPAHVNGNMSSGFMTDLSSALCWTSPNVKVWGFGHTHYNCDFFDGKTGKRVLANQRGYYFSAAQGFEAEKVLCL